MDILVKNCQVFPHGPSNLLYILKSGLQIEPVNLALQNLGI